MRASVTPKDWEDFRATGRLPRGARSEIMASWQRSHASTPPDRKRAPLLDDAALEAARRASARLLGIAGPAMHKAGHLLSQSGRMILISDAEGTVLDLTGDPAVVERGMENHLHLGGRWREDDIGTNAIGTALSTGRPVQVFSSEHFCAEIQRWSCSATPMVDPIDGRILGVIDVSWPAELLREDAEALSAMLSLQIESLLRQQNIYEHEKLNEIAHLRRLRRGQSAMLVLDRYGQDILANDSFLRLCDDDETLDGLRTQLPVLLDRPLAEIEASLECLSPGLSAEVISERGERIGLLLSRRAAMPLRSKSEHSLEEFGRVGPVMAQIAAQAARLARSSLPVLIEGETGTGKSTLAIAMHEAAGRRREDIHRIDCAVLTADQLRQDLATGLAEKFAAHSGMLYLEGPSNCPLDAQKLLLTLIERALDQGVALVAVSTRGLGEETAAGRFRSDLYYRIAVARLSTVPLRERREEIVPHLRQMAGDRARTGGALIFSAAATNLLKAYAWPGNLREMANLVDVLLVTAPNGMIDHRSLPPEFHRKPVSPVETLREGERAQVLDAIEHAKGNLSQAARRLGIARSTLYLKMDSYGLSDRNKG